MKQFNSSTMIVGSQQWIDYWKDWYWDIACKNADKFIKYGGEYYLNRAMECMFLSYMWEDTATWNW